MSATPPDPGGARHPVSPWRAWATGAAGVLALFVILGLLSDSFGSGPQGPASSSYATSSRGLAAWAELLRRGGHRVAALRSPLRRLALAPAATLVVLDPDALLPADGRHLAALVRAGGRLIIGGNVSVAALGTVLADPPSWSPHGDTLAVAVPGSSALPEVGHVRTAGLGIWTAARSGPAGEVLLRDGRGRPVLLRRRLGAGVVDLLADPSPLQNSLLSAADNAAFALDLAPGADAISFAESVHGYGQQRGLAALPTRWRAALLLLALAGVAWVLSRGRRLGPAEPAAPAPAPPRRAYVDALVLLLRRTTDRASLAAVLRAAIDRELVRHAGRQTATQPRDRERALRRLGAEPAEVRALLEKVGSCSDRQLVTLGVTLARVRGRR